MKQSYITTAALALLLAACSTADDMPAKQAAANSGAEGELQICAAMEGTRNIQSGDNGMKYKFSQGDAIGICIVKAGTDISNLFASDGTSATAEGATGVTTADNSDPVWLSNRQFTIADEFGTLKLVADGDDQDRFWPRPADTAQPKADEYDVYAYWPYKATLNGNSLSQGTSALDANQSAADFANYELLLSSKRVHRLDKVSLNFQHVLAMVQIDLTDAQVKKVGGTRNVALLNAATSYTAAFQKIADDGTAQLPTVTVATDAAKSPIVMKNVPETTNYRALLPPQTLPAGTKFQLRGSNADGYLDLITLAADKELTRAGCPEYDFANHEKDFNTNFPAVPNPPTYTTSATGNATIENASYSFSKFDYSPLITNQQYCDFLNAVNASYDATNHCAKCPNINDFAAGCGIAATTPLVYTNGAATNVGSETNDALTIKYASGKWQPYTASNAANPVINVTWYGAKAYAKWAGADLIGEARWQKIFGAAPAQASTNSGYYEWCDDWFSATYPASSAQNCPGPASGTEKVYRNGELGYYTTYNAFRSRIAPAHYNGKLGFRIIK